jgi:hypothetical protein
MEGEREREPTKRELRQQKREIKRAGSQRRRRMLKQQLRENPEDAPLGEFDFGRYSSAPFNGLDHDATRTHSHPHSHSHGRWERKPGSEDVPQEESS